MGKNMGQLVFHEESKYFKTLACMVQKIFYASKSVTDGHTDGHTDGRMQAQTSQKQYAPPTSSKLGA